MEPVHHVPYATSAIVTCISTLRGTIHNLCQQMFQPARTIPWHHHHLHHHCHAVFTCTPGRSCQRRYQGGQTGPQGVFAPLPALDNQIKMNFFWSSELWQMTQKFSEWWMVDHRVQGLNLNTRQDSMLQIHEIPKESQQFQWISRGLILYAFLRIRWVFTYRVFLGIPRDCA